MTAGRKPTVPGPRLTTSGATRQASPGGVWYGSSAPGSKTGFGSGIAAGSATPTKAIRADVAPAPRSIRTGISEPRMRLRFTLDLPSRHTRRETAHPTLIHADQSATHARHTLRLVQGDAPDQVSGSGVDGFEVAAPVRRVEPLDDDPRPVPAHRGLHRLGRLTRPGPQRLPRREVPQLKTLGAVLHAHVRESEHTH